MSYCKWKENQEKYQGDNLCCYETGYPKLLAQNAKEVYAFQTGNKADHKFVPVFLCGRRAELNCEKTNVKANTASIEMRRAFMGRLFCVALLGYSQDRTEITKNRGVELL